MHVGYAPVFQNLGRKISDYETYRGELRLVDLADRARVVWAAASSETRLKDVADRYGFPTTTDVARAIEDPAVDAVLVLTPANAHLQIAEAAFAAGKHVFAEKPVATDAPGVRSVLETVAELVRRGFPVELHLAGRLAWENAEAEVEEKIRALGIVSHVRRTADELATRIGFLIEAINATRQEVTGRA